MNLLITTTIAGLAWWAQGRHDAANTGRAYGHGDFRDNVRIAEFVGPCPVEMSYGPTVGDVNGDGRAEILVVWGGPCALDSIKPGWYWYGYISLYRYTAGTITRLAQRKCTGPVDSGLGLFDCAPALCDVGIWNGPGNLNDVPDVISATGVEGVVYAWELVGNTPFTDEIWHYTASVTLDPSSPKVADLNGDGVHDVVIGGYSGGKEGEGKGPGYLYALNGATGSPLWTYQLNDLVHATPAIGDITGDGNPEVVFTSRGGLSVLGDVGLSNPVLLASFECNPVGSPVLVNLDNDPNLEIALQIWDPNKNKVIALDFTGALVVLWESDIDDGYNPIRFVKVPSPAAGDINGDGTPDVVVAGWENIYALDGRNGNLICRNFDPLDLILASPAIADLDGDPSRLEVVALTVSGLLVVLAYDGSSWWDWTYWTILEYADGGSMATASPTIADCDDDGELEIIVVGGNGCPVEEPTAEPGTLFILDGNDIDDLAWGAVPLSGYNPQPDPLWRSRFYDASVMPPDRAIDRFCGVDPNLVSDTMVAVGEFGFTVPQIPMPPFSYYSRDRGETWNISVLTDPYPIDGFDYFGWEYHLYGVHLSKYLPGVTPYINGVAVGWALANKYEFMPVKPFWYGCILITTDGGKTWQDETGDLLGVSLPALLPRAPLTDAVIVTDGVDHKTWIVGLGGQVYTGRLTNNGLKQVNAPPICYGDRAPSPDLYGVHAYYPYPGTVQNFVWVVGKSWQGGYIDWGYLRDPDNPLSMVWGDSPYCSEEVVAFHDAIYDLWAHGAQMPSLPGYSYSWNEAGITDSVFVAGQGTIKPGQVGLVWGTTDRMKNHELEPYQQNRAFYDISTIEYPAPRRYVFGEGPIRYWDVNFTKGDGLLPDEAGGITIKNDPTDPNPKGRILYGSADNYPLAVGEMNNLPCIWIKSIRHQKQP